MQTTQSYRVTVQVAPADSEHQVGITSTFGLKAKSFSHAIVAAQAVSKLPVRCVVRQDRHAFSGRFCLVATPFGYPMFVADGGAGYSDAPRDATIYDTRDGDSPETKIKYFNAATGFTFEARPA